MCWVVARELNERSAFGGPFRAIACGNPSGDCHSMRGTGSSVRMLLWRFVSTCTCQLVKSFVRREEGHWDGVEMFSTVL